MTEDIENIDPDVYAEILRNTDKKNFINLNERILRKTMVELVKNGKATFLFIRDDETRNYWGKLVKEAATKVEKRREAWRLYEIKQNAWDRLSEEDRKILKLRKPTKPRI
jgi:hypothetical protein